MEYCVDGGAGVVCRRRLVSVEEMVKMIVAVTGWRYHKDVAFINATMERFRLHLLGMDAVVRVGDATGADDIVLQWCRNNRVEYRRYWADWQKFGKVAGPLRNKRMLTEEWYTENPDGTGEMLWRPSRVDLLIGFPEPGVQPKIPGSGSWNCIGQAFTLGIEVLIPAYRSIGE